MMCGNLLPKSTIALTLYLGLGLIATPSYAQIPPSHLAAQTLDQVLDGLRERSLSQIPYQESRSIPALKAPLETRGVLEFIPPETLIKRVESPVASTYLLSNTEIRLTDGATGETFSLKPDAIPELAYIGSSLVSLLMGNKADLLSRWHVTLGGTQRQWEMNLLPIKQDESGLRRVRIEGREGDLKKLYIEALDGSISTLTLGTR
jgi:Outer membrane lipoprotein carrier protein LolA-like